ncbi:hypothetical protein TH61_06230 [Rufibacter sp. DG15C]|uniref:hypothetical protein n=1 Tax=Rufibacter sp. DG15C TaxID=1379909 RepID=UPI00078D4F8A|nr:hypothetical protein [Rufibacter sp. DG15C]AMM50862.1 hypothetical protein TH61_06230 [Rufibacter sp. DG15C]
MNIKSLAAIKQLLVWCLLVGTLSSCGKDEDPTPLAELDYQPVSAGSTWSYGGYKTYTQTSLGSTKNMDGKTYNEFETKQGSTTTVGYIHKNAGIYTTKGQDPTMANVELTYLKENEPTGATWEHTLVVNGISTKYKFTLVAKNLTKTVEANEYKEVIQIKLESTFYVMGQTIPGPPANYFYAKGVGLILSDFGSMGKISLKSYTIK